MTCNESGVERSHNIIEAADDNKVAQQAVIMDLCTFAFVRDRLFQKHTSYWEYYTFPDPPFCPRQAFYLLFMLEKLEVEPLGKKNLGYALR